VFSIGRSGRDPTLQQLLLFIGQRLAKFRRRHDGSGVVMSDALHHLAGVGIAGHDGIAPTRRQGSVTGIQTQVGLARVGIEAMACVAVIGQDWANLPIEVDLVRAAL
jgi:hypothetical protein